MLTTVSPAQCICQANTVHTARPSSPQVSVNLGAEILLGGAQELGEDDMACGAHLLKDVFENGQPQCTISQYHIRKGSRAVLRHSTG